MKKDGEQAWQGVVDVCSGGGRGSPTEMSWKWLLHAVEGQKVNEEIHLAASSVNAGGGDTDGEKRSAAMESCENEATDVSVVCSLVASISSGCVECEWQKSKNCRSTCGAVVDGSLSYKRNAERA